MMASNKYHFLQRMFLEAFEPEAQNTMHEMANITVTAIILYSQYKVKLSIFRTKVIDSEYNDIN